MGTYMCVNRERERERERHAMLLVLYFQKGHGYHLDLFLVAIQVGVCGVLGMPWYVTENLASVTHGYTLRKESETSAPGEKPKFLGMRYVYRDYEEIETNRACEYMQNRKINEPLEVKLLVDTAPLWHFKCFRHM